MNALLDSPMIRLILLFVCGGLFIVCDTLAAYWGKNESTRALVAVIVLSPLSYISFGYLNQKYPLAVASAWVTLLLCIGTSLIGFYFFNDELTLRQYFGLGLALIAGGLLVL